MKRYELASCQKSIYNSEKVFGSGVTMIAGMLLSREHLDLDKLEKAANDVMENCDIFRVKIEETTKGVCQYFGDEVKCRMSKKHFRTKQELEEDFETFRKNTLDIHSALTKIEFVETEDGYSGFFLMQDHIIADAWSAITFTNMLMDAYYDRFDASVAGSYEEHLEYLKSEKAVDLKEKAKNYWMSVYHENGVLEPLIPEKSSSHKAVRKEYLLDAELVEQIKSFVKQYSSSTYSVFMTAVAIYMQQYSRQNQFYLGTSLLNRTGKKQKNTLGMFVHSFAMPFLIRDEDCFEHLTKNTKKNVWDALKYQSFGYQDLLDELSVKEGVHTSLYDVVFNFQNAVLNQENRNFEVSWRNPLEQATPIQFHVVDYSDASQFLFSIDYYNELFTEMDIDLMYEHIRAILKQCLENPNMQIKDLEIITKRELDWVSKINEASVCPSLNSTVNAYLSDVFEKYAKKEALRFKEETITYEELSQRVDCVAWNLRKEGIGRNDIVGLCTTKNIGAIVSLLGIIKAGAAYLPIAPEYPLERKQFMLEDSKAKMILVCGDEDADNYSIPVKEISSLDTNEYVEPLEDVNQPEDLVYIIYTSGTTGKPKGVMIEHRNLMNLRLCFETQIGILDSDVVLQFANLVFDASVWEIFMSVFFGATLLLVEKDLLLNTDEFYHITKENQITVATLPPQYYLQVSDFMPRVLITAGSASSCDVLDGIKEDCTYINAYGPTESTVCSTIWKYCYGETYKEPIPIGIPVKNTRVYVMHGNKLCGLEMQGELCVAGDSIARGYLNREELTSQKFVALENGERIYRTGDLVRFSNAGEIVFYGRMDKQVKIRGFRIELGEIESVIRSVDGVKSSAVMVYAPSDREEKSIYAFVSGETQLDVSEIKKSVAKLLPDYMMPRKILALDGIPYTINGKVDERKLVEYIKDLPKEEWKAPVTKEQKLVANCFEKALGIEHVGMSDNFFEIGGDSIKAIKIASLLRQEGYQIEVKDILFLRTVEEIAAKMENSIESFSKDQGEVFGNFTPTPILREFSSWNIEKPECFSQSILLKSKEPMNENAVKETLVSLWKHHDALRMAKLGEEQYEIKPIEDAKIPSLGVFCYEEELETTKETDKEDWMREKILASIQEGFSLVDGSLIKAVLLNVGGESNVFICIHHMCVDAFSWRILIKDFVDVYNGLSKGEQGNLTAKTSSYVKWAKTLQQFKEEERYGIDVEYWNAFSQCESLKVCSDGVENGSGIDTLTMELSKSCTESLQKNVTQCFGAKVNEVLLAALSQAVFETTSQEKVGIYLESHGRNVDLKGTNCQIDRTVGWFTSKYPFALETKKDLVKTLIDTKERLRFIEGREVGYSLLEEKLDGKLPNNMLFNYLGDFDEISKDNDFAQFELDDCFELQQSVTAMDGLFDFAFDGRILNQTLQFSVKYKKELMSKEQMEHLLKMWKKQVEEICTYATTHHEMVESPADYGYPGLAMEDFEVIKGLYDTKEIAYLLPLTFLQEGMVFHKKKDENATGYVIQNVVEMDKKYSISEMKAACNALADAHDVLRSTYVYKEVSKPVSVVLKHRAIEVVEKEISKNALADSDKDHEMTQIVEADLARGFDLEKDSLLRITVVDAGDKYLLLWTFHHIIMDGWCSSLLLKEFLQLCEQRKQNVALNIKRDRVFPEFVRWLRLQNTEKKLNYWSKLLCGHDEISRVQSLQKSTGKGSNTRKYVYDLTKEASENIRVLAKEMSVSLNVMFEAALSLVLFYYNNTNDVIFGKVISGRNDAFSNIHEAVGLFINTIPVRVETGKEETVKSLVEQISRRDIESMAYEQCPLAEIQSRVNGGHDLFQVLFIFENYENNFSNQSEIKIRDEYLREETNYDITFSVYANDEISLEVLYDEGNYQDKEIELFVKRIEQAVAEIMKNQEVKVDKVNLLTKEEEVLIGRENDFTEVRTIPQVFLEMVEKYPKKPAVLFEDQSLTYEELERQSRKLAVQVKAHLSGKDNFVAIIAERGLELIVSIMAVIRAGAAYVPIDYRYPKERIDFILEDCNAACILTNLSEENFENGLAVIDIRESLDDVAEDDKELLDKALPGDLAYMIYTSGTTGKPKGVMIEHHNLINMITAYQDIYGLQLDDVILQFASIAFDQSVWDIFSGILTGATVLMMPQELVGDAYGLSSYANDHGATVAALTPAFIKELTPNDFTTLRILESGGAEANQEVLGKWLGKVQLFNTYGPTETTVNAITYQWHGEDLQGKLPIGKPIPNTNVYIMQGDRVCGIGVPGELCIAGEGVARGYHNRADLTKEKFVENPYGKGKLYHSGDLARWISEDCIEYLGRIDEQVKIRGFRIELGEIEAVLCSKEEVKDAVVIARKDEDGELYLAAYVTGDGTIDRKEVVAYLKANMPNYMVPSRIMQIDAIPLTSNGKVDKKLLPEITECHEREYVEPQDEWERAIARGFEKVLKVEKVGATDDFFDLGGHSLKAISLIHEIETSLDVHLELKELFQHSTVRAIRNLIVEQAGGEKEEVSIKKAEKKERYRMPSAQKRLYVISQIDDATTYNMPSFLKITGKIDKEKLEASFQRLVELHDNLKMEFFMDKQEFYFRINEEATLCLETETINSMDHLEEKITEFVSPFQLDQAPLFRLKLLSVSEEEHVLLVDLHHIIADGITTGILIHELKELYEGIHIEKPEYSYVDYCEWVNQQDFKQQEKYWLKQLGDSLPVLDMPLDYNRPKTQSFEGDKFHYEMSEETVKAVKKLAEKTGATEYMITMAAFSVLLRKYTRQEDLCIGTPVGGRGNYITDRMPGLFVNTLVMRMKPKASLTVADYIQNVKECCLEALENQEYPFEGLVDLLAKERDLARNPLFDVMFAFAEEENSSFGLSDAMVEMIEIGNKVSKFDLSFEVSPVKETYHVMVEYCVRLYERETIAYMAKHYETVLKAMAEHPECKLEDISLVCEEEEKQLLCQFNQPMAQTDDKTIVDLFEEEVEKSRDKTALVSDEKTMTYDQFNRRVNKLARWIRKQGVKPEDAVLIAADRSIEMVVSVYAVVKAGAMYVPVDVNAPAKRTAYIQKDCQAKLILTDAPEKFRDADCPVFDILGDGASSEEDGNLPRVHKKNNTMYMIYTSGTTGEPKGVEVEHRNLINLIRHMQKTYPVCEGDAYLLKTSYTFDVSLNELFGWFFQGGRLVVLERNGEKDPIAIAKTMETYKVTHATFVPSLLNIFIQTIHQGQFDLKSLQYIFTLGEPIHAETAAGCYKLFTRATLYNLYGPTEATVYATEYEIQRVENRVTIPIGRPLTNYQVYILDEKRSLCGVGVPGELYIAGQGVARGYRNKNELTQKMYLENAFAKDGRMYRTGDLARWLPSGEIECLGRVDNQIKIRGFRVELGEIENAIRKEGLVSDVAVACKQSPSGEKVICAYVVSEQEIEQKVLKNALKKTLPYYMIPAYVMGVDKIPVSASGKLDTKSLPEIKWEERKTYVAPTNELQKTIAHAFQAVLNIEKISITDNFFEMGGQSLNATKVINMLEESEHIRIPLRDFFLYPTVEELAGYMMGQKKEEYQGIEKAEKKAYYKVSDAQKRLLVMEQFDKEGTLYNMPLQVVVHKPLDIEKVQQCVEKMIERHEILRTHFETVENEEVQVVEDHVSFEMEYGEGNQEEANGFYEEFVRPFDLGKAPLMRMAAFKVSEEEYHMFLDVHHIISDKETQNMLLHEFVNLYQGASLDEVKLSYKDYSEFMAKKDFSQERTYWLNQFTGEIPVLDVPVDMSRPSVQQFHGAMLETSIPAEISELVANYQKTKNVTDYMIFLSTFMVLLGKYSRQEDIIVGTPVSGRTNGDMEQIAGLFVNTIALRGKPETKKTYSGFLDEIKDVCLDGFSHQEYPFERILDELHIERNLQRNPLFDVMFTLQNVTDEEEILRNMNISLGEETTKSSKFDFTVTVKKETKGYRLAWEYSTDLFTEESIQYMMEHYVTLLKDALSNPNKTLGELNVVSSREEQVIVHDFNQTSVEYDRDSNICQQFEKMALQYPGHIAVRFQKEAITYEKLNEKANQLARRIRRCQVERNDLVAIMAEKSLETIIGLVAIIKAGCAYVPIDTRSPKERIQMILEDAKPKVVLTIGEIDMLEFDGECIDITASSSYEEESGNLAIDLGENAYAYVIYTSGTTGKPKGAIITQRSVLNLVQTVDYVPLDENTVTFQIGSIAFDASTFDIWAPLLHGGTVCIAHMDMLMDPDSFYAAIREYKITIALVTTALFNQMIQYRSDMFDSMQCVMIGGEQASEEHMALMKGKETRLLNLYGPTENTAYTTYFELDFKRQFIRTPIGKPMANMSLYVMNDGALCGVGIPGELCIAGESLSVGYLANEKLTNEKFVTDWVDGTRIYRTGDLVRWLPDGNIDFMARIDQQVKINGFRIELGEIESVVRNMDSISDCVACVRNEKNKYIELFFVAEKQIDVSYLKNALKGKLPSYMIPNHMMQLDAIPLNQNGKVDVKALPECSPVSSTEFEAAKGKTEERLAEIFQKVLEGNEIGRFDDFFELGGNSINAMNVVNQVREEFGVEISIRDMFMYRTIQGLSQLLNKMETKQVEESDEILPIDKQDAYETSAAQKRMFILEQLDNIKTGYNMPIKMKIEGAFNPEKFRQGLQAIVKRHESFRTAFVMEESGLMQTVLDEVAINVPMEEINEEQVQEKFVEFIKPFDLGQAPLLRCKINKVKEECWYVFLDMHHIIADGTSAGIVVKDLMKFYEDGTLKPLDIQYKDYSKWQNERYNTVRYKKARDYWQNIFAGTIPKLELYTDFERTEILDFESGSSFTTINAEDTEYIYSFLKDTETTLYMLIMSAYSILLHKYSGQNDIVIGSPITGRVDRKLEEVVGMFVNMLPIRVHVSSSDTFSEHVKKMKQNCLDAYDNQIYQFDQMVEDLNVTRSPGRNPVFDVTFSMQNMKIPDLEIQGTKVVVEDYEKETKYDLMLFVEEQNGGLYFGMDYRTSLYKQETVDHFLQDLVTMIKDGVKNPDSLVDALGVVDSGTKETESEVDKAISEELDFDF